MKKLLLISVMLLSGLCVFGGVIPGRWEKVDGQMPGAPLIIAVDSGDRISGSFSRSDSESLTVIDSRGNERSIPKSGIIRVETANREQDSRLNGTMIGFAVGAGGYLGVHASIVELGAHDFPAALGFGGIGALIGFLVDSAIEPREVLFQSADSGR